MANVVDKSRKEKSEPKDVSVVREYISVFLEDLPGSPPGREVEFLIDLIPETTPVSKAPCRLALAEPKELNAQLEELIKKGVSSDPVTRLGKFRFYLSKRNMAR